MTRIGNCDHRPVNLRGPSRIVCLTDETTEILYLLGEQDRIVGISGYSVRPPRARIEKPRVCAFTSAKIDKILAVKPDLVLGFSDLQADIAKDLIRAGINVLVFNQRSIEEILQMVLTLSRIVATEDRGRALVQELEGGLDNVRRSACRFPFRPRVFFEEWNDPLISGIRWVEELIEVSGGEPVFPYLRERQSAKDRIVQPEAVIAADPQVIIASWCGRKVNTTDISQRAGWTDIAAVRQQHIYEVKSTYILQPGPASLTDGLRQLHVILANVAGVTLDSNLSRIS